MFIIDKYWRDVIISEETCLKQVGISNTGKKEIEFSMKEDNHVTYTYVQSDQSGYFRES